MKQNNNQKQQQTNNDMPAIVFEGRAVQAELNDVYDLLTEYAEDAKQSLMDGVEPFEILVQLLDDIDCARFICTVPVGHISKKLANVLLNVEDDSEEDEQQLYVYTGGNVKFAKCDEDGVIRSTDNVSDEVDE